MDKVFESLTFENSSGTRVVLSDEAISKYWELRGRSGFTAPDVNLITQKYVNGRERVVGRIVEPREMSINMVVTGKTTAERDSIFRDMVDKLMDVTNGENGKLYVTRTDGRLVYINCAYSGGLNVTDEYRKFHRFTLTFFAADPYFYFEYPDGSIPTISTDIVTLADDLYLGIWYLGIGNVIGDGIVNNPSGVAIEPVFRIRGRRQNFVLSNITTGETLTFSNLPALLGDELIIDTREQEKAAYIVHANGTTESVINKLDWSNAALDLPLVPGNNVLHWTSYGEEQTLTVEMIIPNFNA